MDNNERRQRFISKFIEENRARVEGDADLIAVIAMEAEEDKYLALFDGMAELSCTGSREKLDAAINDIINRHLESSAELMWVALMTDKMREEFEAWYEGVTGLPVEFNDAGMPVSTGSALSETVTMGMWIAWRASRESLCIELPSKINDQSDKWSNGYDFGIDDAQDALEAAGVQYK